MTTATAKLRTLPVLLLASMMSGCAAIKTIFEAGVWMGVILVVLVLGIIGFAIAKMGRP